MVGGRKIQISFTKSQIWFSLPYLISRFDYSIIINDKKILIILGSHFIYDLDKNELDDVLGFIFAKMFFSWSLAIQQSFDRWAYLLWLKLVLKVEAGSILNFSLASVFLLNEYYVLYEMMISLWCFDSMKTPYTLRVNNLVWGDCCPNNLNSCSFWWCAGVLISTSNQLTFVFWYFSSQLAYPISHLR